MSANCPVGLISGDIVRGDPGQPRQPRFRSVSFANRRGVSSSRAKRRGDADQLFVEQHDRSPLGPAAVRPLSVYRLNRGLQLKASGAIATRRFGKMAFRLFDQWQRPMLGMLLQERNVPAVQTPPRGSAGFAVE